MKSPLWPTQLSLDLNVSIVLSYQPGDEEYLDIWADVNHYDKSASKIGIMRQRPLMRKDAILLAILHSTSILTLFSVAVEVYLFHCPVDDNSGPIPGFLSSHQKLSESWVRFTGLSGECISLLYENYVESWTQKRERVSKQIDLIVAVK
jgi:hypothetical protein